MFGLASMATLPPLAHHTLWLDTGYTDRASDAVQALAIVRLTLLVRSSPISAAGDAFLFCSLT
jgi:hypothetical protein